MRFTAYILAPLLAAFQPILAAPVEARDDLPHWQLSFFTSGCPADPSDLADAGTTAGPAGEAMWCYHNQPAHNVVAKNIDYDKMKVTLFSDWDCQQPITSFQDDGCKVIPSLTVIGSTRIEPR